MIYRKVVKRIDPKSSHHKEKKFFFLFFLLYLHEVMDINKTYCGNHFTIYFSQTIMQYTLNLYSDVCQSYLNKKRRKIKTHK